ncbi:unnamed protein product [Acanthoscelides obtectus]|uniref:Uncharacterized protein n=1 Tax=Acanthoscelides obtectus TaxID=200917 RepID=A0A9P0JMD4_ACAOB|nr:unnamed protein product [Acanthoscelides obtectus]CAK1634832.1 Retinol dehydrogenase 11 [Acanthoscelides obtectus]
MSLAGKTAIVTGSSKGMGYQTALALAARKCKLILADKVNQTESLAKIATETGNEDLRAEFLDLSNLKSVRAFARNVLDKEKKIDILINNAGIFCMDKQKTVDKLDGVMQVNHLGPFLLTELLVDVIRESKQGRIVFVTSSGAFFHNMSVSTYKNSR